MSTKGGQKSGAEAKASNGGKSTARTNAWSKTLFPPPGMGDAKPSAAASSSSSSSSSSVSPSVRMQHRDRLLHLSLTLIGQRVVLQQTNGAIVEGIFDTFTPFSGLPPDLRNKFGLKEILIRQQPETGAKLKDGIALVVPASKVVCLHAKDVAASLAAARSVNGGSKANGMGLGGATFATDTQISGKSGGRTQELVAAGTAWTSGAGNVNVNLGLNSNGGYHNNNNNNNNSNNNNNRNQGGLGGGAGTRMATNSRAAALAGKGKGSLNNHQKAASAVSGDMTGTIEKWDQFSVNKEMFGIESTYDENVYTTELDTSQIDAKKRAEAERIAREIENTTTANIHVAEERGFKIESDFDEEDLYSGVLTKDGKQRHEKGVTIVKKKSAAARDEETKSSAATEASSKPATTAAASASAAPKVPMNYAAAAAKADATKAKAAPPGFSESSNANTNTNASATLAPPPATKETDKKEGTTTDESPKPAVTPEKKEGTDDSKTKPKPESPPTTKEEKPAAPKETEGKTESSKLADTKESLPAKEDEPSKEKPSSDAGTEGDKKEKGAEESTTKENKDNKKKEEKKEVKKSSKLNANAKSFTFNPSAKTFTPSFGAGASSAPAPQHPAQHAATDHGMQMYPGGHPMQPPHYMQTSPMAQAGMMSIMNPQYSAMRYPSSYGMEHHMPQMQHQAPHVQTQAASTIASAPSGGNAPTPTTGSGSGNSNDEDPAARGAREGDDASANQTQSGGQQQQPPQRSQQQQPDQPVQPQGPPQQQQQQQQQQIPMQFPPGAYFPAGMNMAPRGPGGYAQFVTGPQQIGGRPGVPTYPIYPMQPGAMPPNMQMRGPSGAPYYPGPNGHMPYPPGAHMGYPTMMDDGGRGRGGRNSNGGRGGRGRGRTGRGGRGRSNYNNPNHSSAGGAGGRGTQQQYNHHQQQQHQQQATPAQPQGQSGNESSTKSD